MAYISLENLLWELGGGTFTWLYEFKFPKISCVRLCLTVKIKNIQEEASVSADIDGLFGIPVVWKD